MAHPSNRIRVILRGEAHGRIVPRVVGSRERSKFAMYYAMYSSLGSGKSGRALGMLMFLSRRRSRVFLLDSGTPS